MLVRPAHTRPQAYGEHITGRRCAAPDQGSQCRAWALAQAWGKGQRRREVSKPQFHLTTKHPTETYFGPGVLDVNEKTKEASFFMVTAPRRLSFRRTWNAQRWILQRPT